jgi:2-polyprenyl-3-methyl-5-hydroxy-6-metoxy-1,4-benzoquinol methylase
MNVFAPPRRMGHEILDEADVAPALVARSHRDIARSNVLFGGTRAVLARLRQIAPSLPAAPTIVDVGAGSGDILSAVCAFLRARGHAPHAIALDTASALAPQVKARGFTFVRGSIFAMPFDTSSIDLVLSAQTVHHFSAAELPAAVRELNRVARCAVLISDLRRSRVAAAGLWIASFPLGFHPVSRHDGITSIFRGFMPHELAALIRSTTTVEPQVCAHRGWRITAAWRPAHALG